MKLSHPGSIKTDLNQTLNMKREEIVKKQQKNVKVCERISFSRSHSRSVACVLIQTFNYHYVTIFSKNCSREKASVLIPR